MAFVAMKPDMLPEILLKLSDAPLDRDLMFASSTCDYCLFCRISESLFCGCSFVPHFKARIGEERSSVPCKEIDEGYHRILFSGDAQMHI